MSVNKFIILILLPLYTLLLNNNKNIFEYAIVEYILVEYNLIKYMIVEYNLMVYMSIKYILVKISW